MLNILCTFENENVFMLTLPVVYNINIEPNYDFCVNHYIPSAFIDYCTKPLNI